MDSIVCTIDLTPACRPVIAWAAMIARRLTASLCLFHAIHTPSDALHPTVEFERGGELRRQREERHVAIGRLMAKVDVPWRAEVVFGEPVETLLQFCLNHPVDLVLAGSHGIKGLKRLMVGTVVERMARVVPCPLLVLQSNADATLKIDRIGICCDRPDDCRPLMVPGFRLARAFNAKIDLLHAMTSAVAPDLVDPTGAPYGQVQQLMGARLRERLLSMVTSFPGNEALELSIHLVHGEPHECIPELAADLQIGILQVGVRQRSTIGKWVVGSTTEAVLRKAACHVLTVPL